MTRVRCLTVQRDQPLLLDAWLRFHAYLVGFRNLVVHDEGSTDPDVAALLRRAELAGAEIRRHGVGTTLQTRARSAAGASPDGATIVMPLAVDEFLAVYTQDGVSCRREHVHGAFEAVGGERRSLTMAAALAAIVGRACEFSLAASSGPALPSGTREEGECATPLTCLRFTDHPVCLSEPRIVFQGLGHLMEALGVRYDRFGAPVPDSRAAASDAVWVRTGPDENAVRFVGRTYLQAHDDLAASGWPPLLHYALAGVAERRSPG